MEAKLKKQADRGQKAERLLNNEFLQEAFVSIEAEIREGFENSGGDEEILRNAYYLDRALKSLKQKIETIVRKGKDARTIMEKNRNAGNGNG